MCSCYRIFLLGLITKAQCKKKKKQKKNQNKTKKKTNKQNKICMLIIDFLRTGLTDKSEQQTNRNGLLVMSFLDQFQ